MVAIKGLNSNYYLAMSRKGELYGAVSVRGARGSNSGSSTDVDSVDSLIKVPGAFIFTPVTGLSSAARSSHRRSCAPSKVHPCFFFSTPPRERAKQNRRVQIKEQ